MDAERWRRVNELFHETLERDPAERHGFLERACSGDTQLAGEVARLVKAHEAAEEYLGSSVFEHASAMRPALDETPPLERTFGPYRVVRELGRGGMGAVYLAERADRQYEKQVAIKLVKRGMDTEAVIRQFRHERQILATLEHPNVARLIDGGTTDDHLPYFVMEYVEGRPIHQYCEANRLSIEDRLRLFRLVCAAVSYAHQHLVVHRDLKPSNILVNADGVPKLLDFGIARIVDPSRSGETGSTLATLRLMTPDYASPEQVKGLPPTTLSDVYSLGVVLYELLAGRPPYRFETPSYEEVVRTVTETEPPEPSAAARGRPDAGRLRGDLDTIVLKAMRKDPGRRYQSIEQFSDDLQRYLAGRPVRARRDTVRYRAAKFVRRNRALVSAAALIFVTLVAGIVATSWQARRARTQEAAAKAEQARAERRFNEVRQLARAVLFDYHDAIKDLPGSTPVRARLVQDGLRYLDRLASEAQHDRSLQRELASAYERVGDLQGGTMFANLGDTAGAIASYRKALQLYEAILSADPGDMLARRHLALTDRKAWLLLWEMGDIKDAASAARRSVARFQELAASNPEDAQLRHELGRAHDYLGMILQEMGDAAGALAQYTAERDIYESLVELNDAEPAWRRGLSVTYEHIGTLQLQTGDLENALANNRRALDIRSALAAEFPLNADFRRIEAVSYYNIGEILSAMNRTREALESYRQDLARVETLHSEDPNNELYRGDMAYGLIRVGDMLVRLNAHDRALAHYRRSRDLRARDVEADPSNLWKRGSLIEAHAKIAKAAAAAGAPEEADRAAARALALMGGTTLEPTNALFRNFFAQTYADLGDAEAAAATQQAGATRSSERRRRARQLYRQALEIWEDLRRRGALSQIDMPRMQRVERTLRAAAAPAP